MFRLFSSLFLILTFSSCGTPLPEFKDLDLEAWRNDKNACNAYRSGKIEEIKSQKDKFLALDQAQIIALLGKPERNELYKRNQKFYYYHLTPGPECAGAPEKNSQLVIRFNATGLAKEVAIE